MSHFAKDFSKGVRAALAHKGVRIIGAQPIPDMSSEMPWANAERGYKLDDNGCGIVRSYREVLALAGEAA